MADRDEDRRGLRVKWFLVLLLPALVLLRAWRYPRKRRAVARQLTVPQRASISATSHGPSPASRGRRLLRFGIWALLAVACVAFGLRSYHVFTRASATPRAPENSAGILLLFGRPGAKVDVTYYVDRWGSFSITAHGATKTTPRGPFLAIYTGGTSRLESTLKEYGGPGVIESISSPQGETIAALVEHYGSLALRAAPDFSELKSVYIDNYNLRVGTHSAIGATVVAKGSEWSSGTIIYGKFPTLVATWP
jgi:hypothetical protein